MTDYKPSIWPPPDLDVMADSYCHPVLESPPLMKDGGVEWVGVCLTGPEVMVPGPIGTKG